MKQQIDEFMEYLRIVRNTSQSTLQSYRSDLEGLSLYMEERGIRDAAEITEDRLMDYAASLKDKHFAKASIIRHYTSIKAFFRYMVENGNIEDNPADVLRSPKAEKKVPKILSTEEIDSLLNQEFSDDPKGKRDRAILELLYATGLKATELIDLKLSNIDLGLSCIRLPGKTKGSPERLIPYGRKAKEALNSYLLDARNELLADFDNNSLNAENELVSISATGKEDSVVFVNIEGKPLSRQGLWKLIKTYAKKAGISQDITIDTLRNTFIHNLLESGADTHSLKDLLGITDIYQLRRFGTKVDKSKDPLAWARLRN